MEEILVEDIMLKHHHLGELCAEAAHSRVTCAHRPQVLKACEWL